MAIFEPQDTETKSIPGPYWQKDPTEVVKTELVRLNMTEMVFMYIFGEFFYYSHAGPGYLDLIALGSIIIS
jgi:hypothetical protein